MPFKVCFFSGELLLLIILWIKQIAFFSPVFTGAQKEGLLFYIDETSIVGA